MIGIASKVIGGSRLPHLSTGLYLLMGWLIVVAIKPLVETIPRAGLLWLAAGGVAYTGGVVFYSMKRVPYSHMIRHLCVAAGSLCHLHSRPELRDPAVTNLIVLIPLEAIREAANRTGPHLHRTPMLSSRSIGERTGARLDLKCELSETGSFKPRGALNIVLSLSDERRSCGLVTVSAGNHAQAVAWAARVVRVPCTVVMPVDAPRSKMDAVRGYGATIVTHADRSTLFDKLREEEARTGATRASIRRPGRCLPERALSVSRLWSRYRTSNA